MSTAVDTMKDRGQQGSTARTKGKTLGRRLLDAGLLIFLVLSIVIFTILSPYFLSVNNFINILLSVSVIGIVATGMTMVIVGGGLDLSVASTMALAGSVEAVLVMQSGWPWWAGLIAGLLAGLLVGAINAAVISYIKINPIITTLATLSIARGAAYIYTQGNCIYVKSPGLEWLGIGRILGVPVPVILMLASFVGVWAVMRYTVFGRYVYAIGGNPIASRLAGIAVNHYVNIVFLFSSLTASVAGLVLVGLTATCQASAATGYEMDIITAVLLGGTSLAGGEGSVWGTLVGVLIIGIINNGMALLNVPAYWQIAAKGILLLAAVSMDALRRR